MRLPLWPDVVRATGSRRSGDTVQATARRGRPSESLGIAHSVQLRLQEGGRPSPDHNAALGAAVFTAYGQVHPRTARTLHDSPRPSPYVVSELHPARGLGADAFWFRLGSTDDELARNMVGALLSQGVLRIQEARFKVEGIQDVTPSGIEGPVAFHTLSPILLRDPKTKYCYISEVAKRNGTGPDPTYGQRLQDVANHALRTERPDLDEIEVGATLPGKPRKRTLKGSVVYAQTAKLYVDGEPEALAYLATRGLGWSRSHGFGCVVPHRGG